MSEPRILFVTSSYPDGGTPEKGFLLEDLRAMVAEGFAVTLAPIRRFSALDPDMPANVQVTDTYARAFSAAGVLRAVPAALTAVDFWKELRERPRLLFQPRFWQESLRLAVARRVLGQMSGEFDLFYTHWFTADTIGLAQADARPLLTRAHGYDLYEEVAANAGYIPYRRREIGRIDRIVTLSRQARDYAIARFNAEPHRVAQFPLGVPDQEHLNRGGDVRSEIRFASCSFPTEVKRLPLMGRFAAEFAARHPMLSISWDHLGAHEAELGLSSLPLPPNLSIRARGRMSREEVLDFYRTQDVAFFINLSASEGMPVAMMEAMSFGIPVIGTAVGGIPEMLDEGSGVVVPVNAGPDAIAAEVALAMAEPDWRMRMGMAARQRQRAVFSAEKNAARFARFLRDLVGSAESKSEMEST